MGKSTISSISDTELAQSQELLTNQTESNMPTGPVCVYSRAVIKGRMYYSSRYSRVKKSNTYTIAFKEASTGPLFFGASVYKCLLIAHHWPL